MLSWFKNIDKFIKACYNFLNHKVKTYGNEYKLYI